MSKRVEIRGRQIAKASDGADRARVESVLFHGYHEKIYYAALSPEGRGLGSYGGVAVWWDVTPGYLEPRISVHEENSYVFYDRHHLAERNAVVPEGFSGVWRDRSKIAVAKIGPGLNSSMSSSETSENFFKNKNERINDVYIEIVIYHEYGLDKYDIHSVRLESPPNSAEGRRLLQRVRESCAKQRVEFYDIGE